MINLSSMQLVRFFLFFIGAICFNILIKIYEPRFEETYSTVCNHTCRFH